MADYDCEFCAHDNQCKYAYGQLDCFVKTIQAAKVVADDEFKTFITKLEAKNKEMCDDNIDSLIMIMRNIVRDSNQTLPDWATQE